MCPAATVVFADAIRLVHERLVLGPGPSLISGEVVGSPTWTRIGVGGVFGQLHSDAAALHVGNGQGSGHEVEGKANANEHRCRHKTGAKNVAGPLASLGLSIKEAKAKPGQPRDLGNAICRKQRNGEKPERKRACIPQPELGAEAKQSGENANHDRQCCWPSLEVNAAEGYSSHDHAKNRDRDERHGED